MVLMGFRGITAESIAAYDLRPFPGPGAGLQVELWRLLGWAWWVLAATAIAALVVAWRTPGARSAVCCTPSGMSPRLWLALAAVGVLGTALASGCASRCLGPEAPVVGSLDGVSRMTGLSFPPSTTLLEARGYRGWKGALRACLSMPPDVAISFIRTSALGGDVSRRERPRWRDWRPGPMSLWQPEAARSFVSATGSDWLPNGGSVIISMLARLDDPTRAVVYLEWTLE